MAAQLASHATLPQTVFAVVAADTISEIGTSKDLISVGSRLSIAFTLMRTVVMYSSTRSRRLLVLARTGTASSSVLDGMVPLVPPGSASQPEEFSSRAPQKAAVLEGNS